MRKTSGMRRLSGLSGMLAAAMLLSTLPAGFTASAVGETFDDGTCTYEKISGGVRITAVDGSTTMLHVQSNIDGYPILEIGDNAFSSCESLKTLTIDAPVTVLGDGAFAGCTSLTELKLPDSVTEIGPSAFSYCSSLTEFTVPKDVKALYENTFLGTALLESVTLPEGLESIGMACFWNCLVLQELNIPASVQSIAEPAVVTCPALQRYQVAADSPYYKNDENGVLYDKSGETLLLYPAGRSDTAYSIPENVTRVATYAMVGILKMESLTIPESVTEIGDAAFSSNHALTKVNCPDNLKVIPSNAFADCQKLEVFDLPDALNTIGPCAFMRCDALTGIELPASVETIGDYAFAGCKAMKEVTIPETVKTIGKNAFGFNVDSFLDSGEPVCSVMEDFTIHGKPKTAAKTYAKESGVKFDQDGVDTTFVMTVCIAAGAVILLALAIVYFRRRRAEDRAAESELEDDAPKDGEITDPNYRSIIEDDDAEGDPYDRSYGFRAEDDAEDGAEPDDPDDEESGSGNAEGQVDAHGRSTYGFDLGGAEDDTEQAE